MKNKIIEYQYYNCNCHFRVEDLDFDYIKAIYCINCGKDTLLTGLEIL